MPLPSDDIEVARQERARRRAAERGRARLQRRLAALGLAVLIALAGGAAALLLTAGGRERPAPTGVAQKAPRGSQSGGGNGSQPAARTVPALRLPANPAPRSVDLPILTYHRVNPLRPGAGAVETDLTIEPADFAVQMRAIHAAGYHTVTQRQLFEALFKGAKLPSRPVLLTFDDGYVDGVKHILPVLERHRMKGTFYMITSRFEEPGFMNQAQLRELDRAGMDIGSHTVDHVDLTTLPPGALAGELRRSKAKLERVLGHPVQFFCYPSGANNPTVAAAARRAGYVTAVTTRFGTSASARAPMTIPRLHVGRGSSPASVVALLRS